MDILRASDCALQRLGETLQHSVVVFAEGTGLCGKQFE